MFNSNSTTLNNTSLFGESTPVNLNRTGDSFLFGSTNTTPVSTPFLPANLRGINNMHKPSSIDTTTFHKYGSTGGLDKTNKHTMQISYPVKAPNNNSIDILKVNNKSSSTTIPTPVSSGLNSFQFDNKTTTTKPVMTFSFKNSQSSTAISASSNPSFLSSTPTVNVSLDFSLSKPVITSSSAITNTAPVLFSIMNQPTTSTIDLQSFRTMLNTQPFNNESVFLARHNKTNFVHEEGRFRSIMNPSIIHPKTHLFSTMLTKPIVLSSTSISKKRKLVDSFVIDDDDNDNNNNNHSSMIDDGPYSINKLSKLNIKRPRMLDMNKVRSVVLGANEPYNETIFHQSLSSTSENVNGWKKFSTYEEYITTKKNDLKEKNKNLLCLPKLIHKDYYTKPTIEELSSLFNENGECFVKEFTIGRKHYGSVTFHGLHMNLAGLDLDRIVEIGRRQVTVYPNDEDRPAEGEELNCQAIISLLGVYPIDRSIPNGSEEITDPERLIDMNYGKYLEGITNKFQGKFIHYDVYTGTWSFQVEHF